MYKLLNKSSKQSLGKLRCHEQSFLVLATKASPWTQQPLWYQLLTLDSNLQQMEKNLQHMYIHQKIKFKIIEQPRKDPHTTQKKLFVGTNCCPPCFLFFYKEYTNIQTTLPLKSGVQLENKSASKKQECNLESRHFFTHSIYNWKLLNKQMM